MYDMSFNITYEHGHESNVPRKKFFYFLQGMVTFFCNVYVKFKFQHNFSYFKNLNFKLEKILILVSIPLENLPTGTKEHFSSSTICYDAKYPHFSFPPLVTLSSACFHVIHMCNCSTCHSELFPPSSVMTSPCNPHIIIKNDFNKCQHVDNYLFIAHFTLCYAASDALFNSLMCSRKKSAFWAKKKIDDASKSVNSNSHAHAESFNETAKWHLMQITWKVMAISPPPPPLIHIR